jgi:hypothetical protein
MANSPLGMLRETDQDGGVAQPGKEQPFSRAPRIRSILGSRASSSAIPEANWTAGIGREPEVPSELSYEERRGIPPAVERPRTHVLALAQ